MSSVLMSKDKEISEELILLRRMVQLLSQQNAVDQASRQRVIVDNVANIAGGVLSSVTTLSSVTNIAAVAGEGVGKISDFTFSGHFRGDDTGSVQAIKVGKAIGCVFRGTFFGKNPGVVISR